MGNVHMEATQINYREGDKKMSVAQAIKNAGNTGLAHTADIAPEFSTESAYSAGDYVYHNGTLYVFTADHAAGAWSTSDTQAVTVGGELADVKSGLTNIVTGDTRLQCVEMSPSTPTAGNGGFIDFHFNGAQVDYTSRIIEESSGSIKINGVSIDTIGDITVTKESELITQYQVSAKKWGKLFLVNGFFYLDSDIVGAQTTLFAVNQTVVTETYTSVVSSTKDSFGRLKLTTSGNVVSDDSLSGQQWYSFTLVAFA